MKGTVLIGSKLPVSVILNHPMNAATKVTIRGINAAARGTNGQPILVPFITTEVDEDFWTAWNAAHGEKAQNVFPAIRSGAIFVAKTPDAIKGIARDKEALVTGLEGMSRGRDPRMGGKSEQVTTVVD